MASSAQTFTSLLTFDQTNGEAPLGTLIQGTDGNFYGTTAYGGAHNEGTVFKITPAGTLTSLYSFCSQASCTDGSVPYAGLVLGTDGNFYGTTQTGGANLSANGGTVFKITPNGTLTTLYSFCSQASCTDGSNPDAGLIRATNGNFYGTTYAGGNEHGTVFEITPDGKLTTLYSFSCPSGVCPNGDGPTGALIQATNGDFYGITHSGGGDQAQGTIFQITSGGNLTTLYSFDETNGTFPYGRLPAGALVQAANGNFYGTTSAGGNGADNGTVFEITPAGTFTSLYSFCTQIECPDGMEPLTALIQATDGNLYGSTHYGGANNGTGTIFEITLTGQLTTLHTFHGTDGVNPNGLLQATNGTFYGTTSGGGNGGRGTVFSLSLGLTSFVETTPTSGYQGVPVTILGVNLTGATSVTFNGTEAPFTVVSDSEITTKVPSGATTGPARVQTPGGTLTSNPNFQVTSVIHCAICIAY